MKLGILTFHCAHNYGAILQCLGLQEYLKSLGHDVYVIDYRPNYLTRGYKKHSRQDWICTSPRLTLTKLKNEPKFFAIRGRRYENFERFINAELNLYPYISGMNFSEFDAIFLGSDQIWEKSITNGKFDDVFFGVGAKCKVISYAASNKTTQLTDFDIKYYKEHLIGFSGIGVREARFQKLLSSVIDTPIHLNVDPTLLSGSLLKNKIEDRCKVSGKYVLVYEVVEHRKVIENAKKYAKRIGARIVILSAYIQYTDTDIRDQEASPADFVNYIRHAECVFTTSFHGTAISILCQTSFFSYKQENSSDIRIESLLKMVGLEERFVDMDILPDNQKIDYSRALLLLDNLTKQSKMFISESLN